MASIEEAKDIIKNTSISTVIGLYHPISKRGSNFEGICPFHGDSHPSLKINDSKGIYKCFACGAAGDSIKFVQDQLSINFIEAVKDISTQLGITLDEQLGKNKNPKYDIALRVLQVSNKLYKKIALESRPPNFENFLKTRSLTPESVSDFQIGYAPKNNILTNYLNSIPGKEKKEAILIALELGLIRKNKYGQGQYDFYRDRVIFPIWDHSGKVRGFSSRAVLPNQMPKYLNSGESFIFDKGNILYGFNIAKSYIREQGSVIIAEGNMDVISLHQYGFKNSVATMGVSLSQNSVQLLINLTPTIYLAMDSDNAGIKAMTRINKDFLRLGTIAKFIDFSPSKDPDELLAEFGRLELQKRIENAPSFTDYLIQKEIPESIPESTEKKLSILQSIFSVLEPLGSHLFANEKIIQSAKALSLKSSNEDILSEFKKFLEKKIKPVFKKHPLAPVHESSKLKQDSHQGSYYSGENSLSQHSTIMEPPVKSIEKAEKVLLECLLRHPECILSDQITEILDKIQHFEVKRIVKWLKKIYLEIDEAEYPLFIQEKMKEMLPDEIKAIMASALFNYTNLKLEKKVLTQTLFDLSIKLDESLLRGERDALRCKQLQANSDEEGLEVLNKIQKVELKLLALRNK